MVDAGEYRRLAKDHLEQAKIAAPESVRLEHIDRALGYLRLAEQAEKNQTLDLTYETPVARAIPVPVIEQIPPKKEPSR
jgi:hypothetical protein